MIRAIFFDAAGTLIEIAEPVAETYARIAARHRHRIEPDALGPAFRQAFVTTPPPGWSDHATGDAAERDWWRRLVARVFELADPQPWPPSSFDSCFNDLFDHYADPRAWRAFPDAGPALAAAREAGLKTAIVSNFDRRLHSILPGLGLEAASIVTSADARSRKPDAGIFRVAMRDLGVAADEVVHIGDSEPADVAGAREAGIRGILLDRGKGDLSFHLAAILGGK